MQNLLKKAFTHKNGPVRAPLHLWRHTGNISCTTLGPRSSHWLSAPSSEFYLGKRGPQRLISYRKLRFCGRVNVPTVRSATLNDVEILPPSPLLTHRPTLPHLFHAAPLQ
jgi:hypothetical protein